MDSIFLLFPILFIFGFMFVIPIVIGVFVYRDASARGMNALLWTLVAMLVPSLIGVIIYLIVRENYSALSCANCGERVEPGFTTCPSCGNALKEKCPSCGSAVEPHYKVCPSCSAELNQYHDPNREATTVKKGNGLLILAIAGAVLFPFILILLGLFFFMAGDVTIEEFNLMRNILTFTRLI